MHSHVHNLTSTDIHASEMSNEAITAGISCDSPLTPIDTCEECVTAHMCTMLTLIETCSYQHREAVFSPQVQFAPVQGA